MGEQGFGQAIRRTEDARFLTGAGRYTADIELPGQARACFLRSPHAHADIVALDAGAARSAPGVIAVLTGDDAAADGLGDIPRRDRLVNRDGSDPVSPPRPMIAHRRARYLGEPVAIVVAETEAQARDAAELIEVDFEPLDAVGDIAAATAAGAPLVWDDAPGNVSVDWAAGDAEATARAFAEARHVTRLELVDNRVIIMPMEPVAALAAWDAGAGTYTLYAPSQGVHLMRKDLVECVFKLPDEAMTVITPDVGGGFGMRSTAIPEQALVLWAARRTGRPVKWVAERGEAMLSDLQARDKVTRAEMALDGDGRILAIRCETLANNGAYVTPYGRGSATGGYAEEVTGAYDIAAYHVAVKVIFTNTMMIDAYRGAGRPEGIYVVERLIDAAAAELGVAPAELRRRNLVPAAAMPYATVTGETYDTGDFARNLDDALTLAGLGDVAARKAVARDAGKRYGVGLSTYVKINGGTDDELAELAFDEDGGLCVAIGSQSNGQGHETAYAQLAAGRLGVPFESVCVVQGDTRRVRYGQGTGGSSALSVGGVALFQAADKIIETARDLAAELIEAAAADIAFADGVFMVAGTDRGVTMIEVAKAAAGRGAPLADSELYTAQAHTHANGCHVCEVEVDVETGAVAIVGYTSVDDIGRVLNPMIAEGQVHGGIAQGVGQALCEEARYDAASGQLLSGSLMDYCLPRADDLPNIAAAFNEQPCATNPLGVKGVGEAGTTGALAAVVNAVVDALAEYGVRHVDMPLTSEKVWRAIQTAPHTGTAERRRLEWSIRCSPTTTSSRPIGSTRRRRPICPSRCSPRAPTSPSSVRATPACRPR